ncbi:hypothetical protein BK816_04875 [Boudabousia tangfeifanii]|uniref:Magnesium transporter n=1 Tax=Boudabousia tangfeifanii TaxID=1912795 RepID=A0A1D9MK76_9ACTO|nr:magnesium and cobalt transport protein CorA [Boudabousia tangfeifanii]AOZ72707.1 hypothetical protein BK816_04875 [Boudabousia tangfeifanii]
MRIAKDTNRMPRTTPTLRVTNNPGVGVSGGKAEGNPAFVFDDGMPIHESSWESINDFIKFVNAPNANRSRIGLLFLDRPSTEQIMDLAGLLDLNTLLVEDLVAGGQQPKIERHSEALFMVLSRPVYDDEAESVDFTELHIVHIDNLFIVVRKRLARPKPWSYRKLVPNAEQLQAGPEAVLYHFLDHVVDCSIPVVRDIQTDIDEIERQVFSGDPTAPERIYRLSREVIDLQRAMNPVVEVIEDLEYGFTGLDRPQSTQDFLDDVEDHLTRVVNRIADFRDMLTQILEVNSTLADQRRNEDMKVISSWGAILLVPTLIGSIYGMNFDNMPELHWEYGYLAALGSMLLSSLILFIVFKKKDWL